MRRLKLLVLALLMISPAAKAADWNGFYIGFQAGYGWQSSYLPFTNAITDFQAPLIQAGIDSGRYPQPTANTAGLLGGFYAGYDVRFARQWFAGVEADFSISGMKDTAHKYATDASNLHTMAQTSVDWFATARGRLGFLPAESTAVYLTGGLAAGRVKLKSVVVTAPAIECSLTAGGVCVDIAETRLGWTLGGGVAFKLDRNWGVRAEYLYYDLGSIGDFLRGPTGGTLFSTSMNFRGNIVRGGIDYRF